MIEIINTWTFYRKDDCHTVYADLGNIAGILTNNGKILSLNETYKYYFDSVFPSLYKEDAHVEKLGDLLDFYIPLNATSKLIESLNFDGILDSKEDKILTAYLGKMTETQKIISNFFDKNGLYIANFGGE